MVSGRVFNSQGDFTVMGDNELPTSVIDEPWQTPAARHPDDAVALRSRMPDELGDRLGRDRDPSELGGRRQVRSLHAATLVRKQREGQTSVCPSLANSSRSPL